jgi:hypothetical protein
MLNRYDKKITHLINPLYSRNCTLYTVEFKDNSNSNKENNYTEKKIQKGDKCISHGPNKKRALVQRYSVEG